MSLVVAATGVVGASLTTTFGDDGGDGIRPAAAPGSHRVVVLDANDAGAGTESVAWTALVSDGRMSQVRRYTLDTDADIVASPDGELLYSVGITDLDTDEPRDVLTAIDLESGKILYEVPFERWQGTTGFHLTDKIVISPDGTRIFVLVGFPADSLAPPQAVAVFDTVAGEFLPETISLQSCGGSPVLMPLTGTRLAAACNKTLEVELIDVASDGSAAATTRVDVSLSDIAAAGVALDRSEIYVASRAGEVAVVDAALAEETETGTIDLPESSSVALAPIEVADGNRLLLATTESSSTDLAAANGFVSVAIGDWDDASPIRVGPFSWYATDGGGGVAFAVDARSGALRAVAAGGRGTAASLGSLGRQPVSVQVLPSP